MPTSPDQHLREQAADDGPDGGAAADQAEQPPRLTRVEDAVGERPGLHGRDDPVAVHPDVEDGRQPRHLDGSGTAYQKPITLRQKKTSVPVVIVALADPRGHAARSSGTASDSTSGTPT